MYNDTNKSEVSNYISRKGGLKGGKISVTQKLGIFSDNYTDEDRSNASKMGIAKQKQLGIGRYSWS